MEQENNYDILKNAINTYEMLRLTMSFSDIMIRRFKVLFIRPFVVDKWTITGGYIKKTESIEEAALELPVIRTGLQGYLSSAIPFFRQSEKI